MEDKKENNSKNISEVIIPNKDNPEKLKAYNQIKESSKTIIKESDKTISIYDSSELSNKNKNNEDSSIKTEKELIKNKNIENINIDEKNFEKEKIKDLHEEKKLKEKNNISNNSKKDKEKKKCCKSCYYFCGCNKKKKDYCNLFCRYCCDNIYRNCIFF